MCDYSLHHVASRPAKVGDELLTTRFAGSITRGFCAVGEPSVAVCLRPGTELVFEEEAEFDHPLAWLKSKGWLMSKLRFGKIGAKAAIFRQIDLERPDAHHDALEFGNGNTVLITTLRPGQRASVLQLPASVASAQTTGNAEREQEQSAAGR